MPEHSLSQTMRTFRQHFAAGDVKRAMLTLNEVSGFRFTGLYLFAPPTLQNVYLVDGDEGSVVSAPDVSLETTFCMYTGRHRRPLTIEDAPQDPRWVAHPARDNVQAYCGVPLLSDSSRVHGTVCHFDYVPRMISPFALEVLEAAAPIFAGWVERELHSRGHQTV